MKKIIHLVSLLTAAVVCSPATAQVVAVKQLSRDMVLTLLTTAVKCAQTDKVTVVIVDRQQLPIAQFRGPTATINTLDIARRKASTAAQFGQPTSTLAAQNAEQPARAATLSAAGELVLGGALPIKLGDETLGAIGLSGAGAAEEKCAAEAIAAIQSQLK